MIVYSECSRPGIVVVMEESSRNNRSDPVFPIQECDINRITMVISSKVLAMEDLLVIIIVSYIEVDMEAVIAIEYCR